MKVRMIRMFIITLTAVWVLICFYVVAVLVFSTQYDNNRYRTEVYAKGMGLENFPATYDELISKRGAPEGEKLVGEVEDSPDVAVILCSYPDGVFEVYQCDTLWYGKRMVNGFKTTGKDVRFGSVKVGMWKPFVKLLYWRCPTIACAPGELCFIDGDCIAIRFVFSQDDRVEQIIIGLRE